MKISEVMEEYKKSKITNESIEMYKEVMQVLKGKMKYTDKVERKYDEQSNEKEYYENKHKNCVDKMEKLKEDYPVKTKLALIPIVGRFGNVAKEYNRLRRKAKRAKYRMKLAKKTMKDLEPVCKKCKKELKLTAKDLKRCEKALKRTYKADKSKIELSKMFIEKENILRRVYEKESFDCIKKYIERIRNGEKNVELPKGIDSQKDLLKKIKSDIKAKTKGKEIEQFVIDTVSKNSNNNTDKKKQKDNKMIFAKKGIDIKRDFVKYEENINGAMIKLSPEETLNYIGFISIRPDVMNRFSKEKILKSVKESQKLKYADKGWDILNDMIKDIKDKNTHIDVQKLSESEKIVYSIAKKYVKKEEKDKAQKQNVKDPQQLAI